MNKITASEELIELVAKGIDHAIYSIQDGDGPLIPFVMIQIKGQTDIIRFMEETLEECVLEAKNYLIELPQKPDFAVMAYEGRIAIEGTKYDAIMVDGFDKKDIRGYCFAQRYKPKKLFSRFKEIGKTAFVEDFESLLVNK